MLSRICLAEQLKVAPSMILGSWEHDALKRLVPLTRAAVKLHCLAGMKVFVHTAVELKSIPVHIMVLWGLYSVAIQL